MAGSLMAAARDLARYKLDLVGVQEVRWDKGGTVRAGDYKKYKILSNILHSKLIAYAQEIIGDHQCGFRSNRSATAFIKYLRKKGNTMKQCVSYL
jgi:hypothetical protein